MKEERELARRLNSATVHLMRALRAGPGTGLAAEHQSVLTAIVFGGPIALGDLARREGVGAPAMTKTIGILERRRLVRRARGADDARVVRVSATTAGRRTVLRGRDARVVRIAKALHELDPAAVRQIRAAIGALERLVTDLERPEATEVGTLVGVGRPRPLPRR